MDNSSEKKMTIEQRYKKLTHLEHILLRPDTYVGSLQMQNAWLWVLSANEKKFEYREIHQVPGLYKIFDEILVNAADNYQRERRSMNKIQIDIDPQQNCISVWNNGQGIPVEIHKEQNVYVPGLIFGELLTGSNYDDNEKKLYGGRNGQGAKLTNIFSTKFIIEVGDAKKKR